MHEQCTDGNAHPGRVKTYVPNRFGIYNVFGNVREWTSSCLHKNYNLKFCDHVAIAGSSAYFRMSPERESRGGPDATSNDLGFRLVVDLPLQIK